MIYRQLILNPGSTSTKIAIYDNDKPVFVRSITHTNHDLAPYPTLNDQLEYRTALVRATLAEEGIELSTRSGPWWNYSQYCGRRLCCGRSFAGLPVSPHGV